MQPLTFDQLYALPTTVDLMTAARALRIGRTLAYQLARADEFPCPIIRVGNGYHVPTAGLLEALGIQRPDGPRTDPGGQKMTG